MEFPAQPTTGFSPIEKFMLAADISPAMIPEPYLFGLMKMVSNGLAVESVESEEHPNGFGYGVVPGVIKICHEKDHIGGPSGSIIVWCDECCEWHHHGLPANDMKAVLDYIHDDGSCPCIEHSHRVAHCGDSNTDDFAATLHVPGGLDGFGGEVPVFLTPDKEESERCYKRFGYYIQPYFAVLVEERLDFALETTWCAVLPAAKVGVLRRISTGVRHMPNGRFIKSPSLTMSYLE